MIIIDQQQHELVALRKHIEETDEKFNNAMDRSAHEMEKMKRALDESTKELEQSRRAGEEANVSKHH